ncbi:AcrR family transcriptional regulator [Saccharothrix ecbatanensis]|uniref:AcrR family transcriptional regulator n=1 Tax=Saccharothrix ecbatanensis TaxID=1105145 RepID=A0A7W9HTC6_9PSEU|nr:TetR/AcrR family transcriptional regulator [Saccharothrix ecbatanensis]MBB5808068.1 AcrR family transcriptional regulator [Saccharothrix ecbatanensis]
MPEQEAPRERLLAAVVDHLAEHGLTDVSLRRLAKAVGSSHRMLIYHFGSMEGLLVEVVRAVEAKQRAVLASLLSTDSPAEAARKFWRVLVDPSLRAHERLFFELYAQAAQGRPGTTPLLDGIVTNGLEPVAAVERAHGHSPEVAAARARLGLAVARGLLLDLVATNDEPAVTAAMDHFITLMHPTPTP